MGAISIIYEMFASIDSGSIVNMFFFFIAVYNLVVARLVILSIIMLILASIFVYAKISFHYYGNYDESLFFFLFNFGVGLMLWMLTNIVKHYQNIKK